MCCKYTFKIKSLPHKNGSFLGAAISEILDVEEAAFLWILPIKTCTEYPSESTEANVESDLKT